MTRIALFFIGLFFIAAWAFMLLVSAVHSLWLPMLPIIGYVNTLFLFGAIAIIAFLAWLAQRAWDWVCGLGS
jgi:hypothetical protein